MSESYSVKDVLKEFRDDTKDSLLRIEAQTTKTNGRVNNLENHKAYLWGAISVIVILGGALITLSIMAIDNKIKNGIAQALEDNVSTIQYEQ